MQTIDKLLRYNINDFEKTLLIDKGIINGCGGKNGFNISEFLSHIESLPYCNKVKFTQFKEDFEKLCNEHDIDFELGGGLLRYIEVNSIFINGVHDLIWWIKPSDLNKLTILGKIGLCIGGIRYYRWSFKRKEFAELFIK